MPSRAASRRGPRWLLCGILAAALVAAAPPGLTTIGQTARDSDHTPWVDPLIGSFAPGFTNPGPVLPHGMVGLGPDTEGPLNYGGYYVHNATVTGFSHVHMSAGVYQGGQFPLLPVTGEVAGGDLQDVGWTNPVPAYASPFSHANEQAEPGYYRVRLDRYGVDAELTATERTGWHRYTFPEDEPARVVAHVGRDLKGTHPATLTRVDERTLVSTVATTGPDHEVHAAIRFRDPVAAVTTLAGDDVPVGGSAEGEGLGVVVDLGAVTSVQVNVGISFTDRAGALTNLAAEAHHWEFDETRAAALEAWRDALGVIDVEGGTDADRISFYTALYHTQLFPNLLSDADGRYRGPDDTVRDDDTRPHYSQFSLWDSYRGQNALLAVISPDRYADMLASLRDFADESGALPRWQLAYRDPGYMSGDPATMFVAEGVCRGVGDPALHADLYRHALALRDRRPAELDALGYLPTPQPANPAELVDGGGRNAGTTLEFGVADAALALVAARLGDEATASALTTDAGRWANLLDPGSRWIRPRDADGAWAEPFRPELGYGFQEGTAWQYSWLAMHDLPGLVDAMGGADEVTRRLDEFFNLPATATVPVAWPKVQNQATVFGIVYAGNQYAPGNEHDLEAPFVYNAAGQPWRTQAVARGVASLFTPTPDGLPGNDDLGAMSGWLVWTLLGVHPVVPGAPIYTLASPAFERATIERPDGGELKIEAPGTSLVSRYVHDPRLDDAPLERTWFTEAEWAAAETLRVEMSPVPETTWGTSPEAAPPSLEADGFQAFGCGAPGAS